MWRIISETFRLLTFQNVRMDVRSRPWAYALIAVGFAWLAGIGRFWDHPSADWYEYAGLRSVAYIFILTAILYVVVWPLRVGRWRWLDIFVFVGLTSPLAWLYAIPVERFVDIQTARNMNINFLMVVALWRVALYGTFLWRYAGLRKAAFLAAWLAPLAIILFALVSLNLENAVFEIMAGIERERSDAEILADQRYGAVNALFFLSVLTVPVWGLAYLGGVFESSTTRKRRRLAAELYDAQNPSR